MYVTAQNLLTRVTNRRTVGNWIVCTWLPHL